MPPNRSFSFESDQGRIAQYDDSSDRFRIVSPPPDYTPGIPLTGSVSPISSHRLGPASQRSQLGSKYEQSFDIPRKPTGNNLSEAVPPPPPPPHRSIPSYRDGQRSVTYTSTGMDNAGQRARAGGWGHGYGELPDDSPQRMRISSAQPVPSSTSRDQFFDDRLGPNGNQLRQEHPLHGVDHTSYASNIGLTASAGTQGAALPYDYTHNDRYSDTSSQSYNHQSHYAMGPVDHHSDSPYHTSGLYSNTAIPDAEILPNDIADDGDDGFLPEPKRKSMMPLNRDRSRERNSGFGHAAAAGPTGGILGAFSGRKEKNIVSSGSYNVVPGQSESAFDKSEWLSRQKRGNNKMRWIVGVAIGAVVVIAVVAGIIGGVLGSRSSLGGSSSGNGDINNAASDTAANGDLDLNSAEIKALMNNKNLHKVFPGMDYTPWGTQYPLCLTYPPSQNNVTRDMAVLSQLTNAVRLYGTDCNQTEMVLHSIDRLKLTSMKVWLGVWIDPNTTTTQRQLDQMYQILADAKDLSIFKGVIVGNEALYRAGEDKAATEEDLITILNSVRSNFTSLGYSLSVSTSDLGDNWNGPIAAASDLVMSNIHPFFAGVNVTTAAAWTWDFWQTHDVTLQTNLNKQVISETGWPSGGGTDCGNEANICAAGDSGAVASVANMNIFMQDWVCQALSNGTEYFWFEAFDEAWKVVYNTPGKEWEDKWGLMDTARNLKQGLVIPSCGGQTVP